MLICRNTEGVRCQRKVGNPCFRASIKLDGIWVCSGVLVELLKTLTDKTFKAKRSRDRPPPQLTIVFLGISYPLSLALYLAVWGRFNGAIVLNLNTSSMKARRYCVRRKWAMLGVSFPVGRNKQKGSKTTVRSQVKALLLLIGAMHMAGQTCFQHYRCFSLARWKRMIARLR